MRNKLLAIGMVILALVSCAQDPIGSGRADLTITTNRVTSRTIIPVEPEIVKYSVTLDGETEDYSGTFTTEENITFSSVLVGSYNVIVDALDSSGVKVAEGSASVTIKATGSNSTTVNLSYLESGTGKMVVDISWSERGEGFSGPFEDALKNKSLGFRAMKSDGKAYVDAIQWADEDDFANKKITYTADGLAKTNGESIYFEIYTKIDKEDQKEDQVIARTFYTVVQILPNLTSIPDANERDNFKITDDSIISYIMNVRKSSVKATINENNPDSAVDISWVYPKLSNGKYNGTLIVTLYDSKDNLIEYKEVLYDQDDENGSETFSGLSTKKTYKVTFQNRSDFGYSTTLTALENIRTKIVVDSIKITSNIKDTYTMGESVKVDVNITPEYATLKEYTISVTPNDGVTVNDAEKTVTFNKAGAYNITVEPKDVSSNATDSKEVKVLLSTPANFTSALQEKGILLSWAKVESATGYRITKTIKEISKVETIDIPSNETTSYLDSATYAGMTHTYTIQAVSEDNLYDSAASDATEQKIEPSDITIKLPENIESIELTKIDFGGNYLVLNTDTEEHKTLSVSISNDIEGATYSWLLNGKKIAPPDDSTSSASISSEVQNITIENTNKYLNISGYENANTLTLVVTVNGKQYSISGTFYLLREELKSRMSITLEDGSTPSEVRYNSPIKLKATFNPELDYDPHVVWEIVSNNEEEIAAIDQSGKLTSLRDGNVTVRATAVATGLTKEITIKSYIPAKDITMTATQDDDIIIKPKNGVVITNAYRIGPSEGEEGYVEGTYTISASATPANGEKTSSSIKWKSSNPSVLEVDEQNGKLTVHGPGVATISASIDGITREKTITVLDLAVKSGETDITNGSVSVERWGWSEPVPVQLVFNTHNYTNDNNPLKLNCVWGFNGSQTNKYIGSSDVDCIKIQNENNFTAELRRFSNTNKPTVSAFLQLNDTTIASVSFTANT